MKPAAFITTSAIILVLLSCGKQHNFLHGSNKQKLIAIQTFGDYDTSQLKFIAGEIERFYNKKVILLNPVHVPSTFLFPDHEGIY